MSLKDQFGPGNDVSDAGEFTDKSDQMDGALSDFRLSVHAWSVAEFNRPRFVAEPVRRRAWRLAVGWALGCALVVGSVSAGAVYKHHVTEVKIAQARMIEQQRLLAEQQNLQARQAELLAGDDSELAKVDSDVSREVPSAMEPLAQLMAEDESQ
ncbi:MAG: hypothetical protein ABR905_13650 [Terracidiphilus sp.]|jgi:hypothetical protein